MKVTDAERERLREQLKTLRETYDTKNDSETLVACVQEAYERAQQVQPDQPDVTEARDANDSADAAPATH